MSARNRFLFFLTAWLIVLMPFLFWWNTWFGRHLSDKQITEYLQDTQHPRHIQHALVQVGERMARHDSNATQWYPALILLAANDVEEVRNTDAWVMGQDTAAPGFHETLLKMLQDPSPIVRGNAALSLVRFGDASGHDQIVALVRPRRVETPLAGLVMDVDRPGTVIRFGGLIAKIQVANAQPAPSVGVTIRQIVEVRSPISGRIRSISAPPGANVEAGAQIAIVDPGDEQVWEALRALYLIGKAEDLTEIQRYEREVPEISDRVRQQAVLTEKAIRERARVSP
jgi:biotin carboxyl carrier protein